MKKYKYKLSLRITHPSRDLSVLCQKLGLKPKWKWKAGDRRATPSGKLLVGRYDRSYCCIAIAERSSKPLPRCMKDCLDQLRPHRRMLANIVATGGTIEFFVGWFAQSLNSGEVFDWQILQEAAKLKISLSLDFYSKSKK